MLAVAVLAGFVLTPTTARVATAIGTPTTAVTAHEVFATPPTITVLGNLDCPTTGVCYLASNPIVKTVDGGSTWSPLTLDANDVAGLRGIDCHSDRDCDGIDGANGLWHTVDGGLSWTRAQIPTLIAQDA